MVQSEIKALIELSSSFESADSVINTYTNMKTYSEKIEYLQNMFDVKIVSINVDSKEADYKALLTSIVEKKWNC